MDKSQFEQKYDIAELRQQLRRHQVYLGAALSAFGIGSLIAVGLAGFYGFQLAETLSKAEARVSELEEETQKKNEELERGLARQQEDLAAIQRAAIEDLEAIREANRKFDSVRDPSKELSALREANEALWKELANQRAELLDGLRNRGGRNESPPLPRAPRFRLGETHYTHPADDPDAIKGFVAGDQQVFRATAPQNNSVVLLIDVKPEGVRPGDPYQLSVRVVNQSYRLIAFESLRLDWSFNGKNTGGPVPVAVAQVKPQDTQVLYSLMGHWTEAHELGPVSVTASLAIYGGASATNVLRW
ncbi:MAG: hypothetical protein ACRD3V_12360 [Vicinamibacteria bacterium]